MREPRKKPRPNYRQIACDLVAGYGCSRVAEVGVWAGDLSKLLWQLPLEKLYLVDPMSTEHLEVWREGQLRGQTVMGKDRPWTQEELDELYEKVVSEAPAFVTYYRMSSVAAAGLIPDGFLDFVFVDAMHYYQDLVEDIETWKPKLCPGGILAGDDLYERFPGVKRALDEKLPGYCNKGKIWWAEVP